MATLRIPLVGSITNRKPDAALSDTTDQQFINCFPELVKNDLTGKSELILNKRWGSTASSDVSSGASGFYGSLAWNPSGPASTADAVFPFLKSGGTSTAVFNQSASQVGGDINPSSGTLAMGTTQISGTNNLTLASQNSGNPSASQVEMWFYPSGGAWTKITDTDFPTFATPSHAHKDGYMFVMSANGSIHNSDPNSLSSWSAGNYISLTNGGGLGGGLVAYRDYIVGFSNRSTEYFYNAGNAAGSVLKRVNDGVIPIGCMTQTNALTAPSFRVIGDSIYLIGLSADAAVAGIYKVIGTNFEKISNAAIDRLVAVGRVNFIVGAIQMWGKTHILFGGSTILACYCPEMKFWWYLTGGGTQIFMSTASRYINGTPISYFVAFGDSKVYTFSGAVWTDNAVAYTMTVRTGNLDLGTRRKKFFESLSLIGDSQTSTSTVNVSYSDDDYVSFTSSRPIDMNIVPSPRLTRLGASRRRAWQLTHSAATPCRLATMEIDYTVGPF